MLAGNVSPELTVLGILGQNIPGWLSVLLSVLIAIYVTYRGKKSTEKHIHAVEKASLDQIAETRYWIDLKRRQLLRSLIEELKSNIGLLKRITNDANNGKYHVRYDHINLVVMEKCLADTPINDDELNKKVSSSYQLLKIFQNFVQDTRLPLLYDAESLNKDIASRYPLCESIFETLVRDLESYYLLDKKSDSLPIMSC